MALESWVLDGIPLTSGNFLMMALTADPPKAKPQWISGADSEWASLLNEPLHENREFVMKLRIPASAALNMDAALDLIASIRDKLRKATRQDDGVALVWTPNGSARSRTFDVLFGEITELPIDKEGEGGQWMKGLPIFSLSMTAKPYWYDTSETLTSTSTAATPVVTIDVPSVGGDIPALARLIVTDNATQVRRDVEWGLENRNYNAGLTFMLDSDSLVTSGFSGAQTTRSGSYDPNATGNNIIRAATVLTSAVAVCGTGTQSHVGTFRVWARCYFANITQRVRLAWRSGDNRYISNAWAYPPSAPGFVEVDLGTITVPTAISGTQTWDGRIEAYESGTTAPAALDVDFVRLTPAGEGYGRARAVFAYAPGAVSTYDPFETLGTGTGLNARVATGGGTWATSGATTDFVGTPVINQTVSRSTSLDASTRFGILGSTNYTDVEVSAVTNVSAYGATGQVIRSVVARWVDASNFFIFSLVNAFGASSGYPFLMLQSTVAASAVNTRTLIIPQVAFARLRLVVYASGLATGTALNEAGAPIAEIQSYDSTLATGGTLATGKPGIADRNTSSALSRYYDDFYVSVPPAPSVVINSGRSIQFRHDDTIRLDSTGAIYGKPQSYRGGRFLVPPGTSRVAVAPRRVDLTTSVADNVTDSTTLQVGWRARGLVVPRV